MWARRVGVSNTAVRSRMQVKPANTPRNERQLLFEWKYPLLHECLPHREKIRLVEQRHLNRDAADLRPEVAGPESAGRPTLSYAIQSTYSGTIPIDPSHVSTN